MVCLADPTLTFYFRHLPRCRNMRRISSSWNSLLTKLGLRRMNDRTPRRRISSNRRLRLESLELREMLAAVTVSNLVDVETKRGRSSFRDLRFTTHLPKPRLALIQIHQSCPPPAFVEGPAPVASNRPLRLTARLLARESDGFSSNSGRLGSETQGVPSIWQILVEFRRMMIDSPPPSTSCSIPWGASFSR